MEISFRYCIIIDGCSCQIMNSLSCKKSMYHKLLFSVRKHVNKISSSAANRRSATSELFGIFATLLQNYVSRQDVFWFVCLCLPYINIEHCCTSALPTHRRHTLTKAESAPREENENFIYSDFFSVVFYNIRAPSTTISLILSFHSSKTSVV